MLFRSARTSSITIFAKRALFSGEPPNSSVLLFVIGDKNWLTTLYEIWKNLDQDVIYHSSITGMGELLKTGCTTCFDHHYVFPDGNSDALLDAQFSAAKDLGIRMYASRGSEMS